jgi:hypothetical protein
MVMHHGSGLLFKLSDNKLFPLKGLQKVGI